MIDIGIRPTETPQLRIGCKSSLHVFVNLPLEINTHSAHRPDDYVRANTTLDWHITTGILQHSISGVVLQSDPNLLTRGFKELCGGRRNQGERQKSQCWEDFHGF